MAVPRPFITDSRCFGSVAVEVIEARSKWKLSEDKEERRDCPVWNPFVFGKQQGVSDVAHAFRKDLLNEDFLFSSLPTLNLAVKGRGGEASKLSKESRALRKEMAKHVKKSTPDWGKAAAVLPGEEGARVGEVMGILHEEFKMPGAHAGTVTVEPLRGYLANFKDPENTVAKFNEALTKLGRPPGDKQGNSRSFVRANREQLLETGLICEDEYLTVVELLDNAYNDAVARSNQVGGRLDSSSTELDLFHARRVEDYHAKQLEEHGMVTSPLVFRMTDSFEEGVAGGLESDYDPEWWTRIWDWLWQEVFLCKDWQASVRKLNGGKPTVSWGEGWKREEADDHWREVEKHVNLLQSRLANSPFVISAARDEGLAFRILRDSGSRLAAKVAEKLSAGAVGAAAGLCGVAAGGSTDVSGLTLLFGACAGAAATSAVDLGGGALRQRHRIGVASRMLAGVVERPPV